MFVKKKKKGNTHCLFCRLSAISPLTRRAAPHANPVWLKEFDGEPGPIAICSPIVNQVWLNVRSFITRWGTVSERSGGGPGDRLVQWGGSVETGAARSPWCWRLGQECCKGMLSECRLRPVAHRDWGQTLIKTWCLASNQGEGASLLPGTLFGSHHWRSCQNPVLAKQASTEFTWNVEYDQQQPDDCQMTHLWHVWTLGRSFLIGVKSMQVHVHHLRVPILPKCRHDAASFLSKTSSSDEPEA